MNQLRIMAIGLSVTLLIAFRVAAQEDSAAPLAGRTVVREFRTDNAGDKRGADIASRPFRAEPRAEPRFDVRQTHRGVELAGEKVSVISPHGAEHAKQIRAGFAAGWEEISRLMEPVSDRHLESDFAHGAIQVIESERLAAEGDFEAIVSRNEPGAVIYLPVGDGERNSQVMAGAAVEAFFQVNQFDQSLPSWVREGLVAFVAEQQATDESEREDAPRIGVVDWNGERGARSNPVQISGADDESRDKVTFLLTGDEGEHTLDFLLALRQTVEMRDSAASGDAEPLAELLEKVAVRYASWQQDPQHDQPIVRGPQLKSEEDMVARDQLLVLLKLASRYDSDLSQVQPQLRTAGTKKTTPTAITPEKLLGYVTDPEHPRAIVDARGQLILPHQREELKRLFGLERSADELGDHDVVFTTRDQQLVATRPLNGLQELRGWLEANPENPARRLAKFEIARRK